jgi:MSHA biogenesis protein MshO
MRGRQSSPSCNPSRGFNGSPSRNGSRGFTLVELVITIVVGSVVVAFMALFIVTPVSGYMAQTRRATLVDEADGALRFMGRDIKSALPNSVRVTTSGTVTAVEFLATLDGARYVDGGPLSNPALALDFTTAATAFSTAVPFSQITLPWTSSSAYLVIYNVGVPGANAYQMANVITPAGTTINIAAGSTANQDLVTLSPGFQFAYESPEKRVYLVSGPVSYLCDTSAGTLTRYSGYTITSSQAVSAAALTAAGATASQVTADVASCTFTYSTATATRNALVELSMKFTNTGETVQLLYEVQLVNSP